MRKLFFWRLASLTFLRTHLDHGTLSLMSQAVSLKMIPFYSQRWPVFKCKQCPSTEYYSQSHSISVIVVSNKVYTKHFQNVFYQSYSRDINNMLLLGFCCIICIII